MYIIFILFILYPSCACFHVNGCYFLRFCMCLCLILNKNVHFSSKLYWNHNILPFSSYKLFICWLFSYEYMQDIYLRFCTEFCWVLEIMYHMFKDFMLLVNFYMFYHKFFKYFVGFYWVLMKFCLYSYVRKHSCF